MLVLQAASGRRPHVTIFGRDYDTPDGTCIRDYIHVNDPRETHWLAAGRLPYGAGSGAYNPGNGAGCSVRNVIDTARVVTGRDIGVAEGARCADDPSRLVADSTRARTELGWIPRYSSLETVLRHAWERERRSR